MIPKRTRDTDISSEVFQGRKFRDRLFKLADEVARRHASNREDLPGIIADIAKREGFDRMKIQRLIEEGNTRAYLARYEQVRALDDRRFTFIPAEMDTVIMEMGDAAPPEQYNPNWVFPTSQGGNMQKSASTHESQPSIHASLHRPFDNLQSEREKLAAKREAEQRMVKEAAYKKATREVETLMHKVASACVHTQRMNKSGGQLFNTIVDQGNLSVEVAEGIAKRAGVIQEELKQRGAMHPSSMVDFKLEATEKVASHMLGNLSLLSKQASTELVEKPVVAPSASAANYDQLLAIAQNLQAQAEVAQANQPTEVK